MRGRELAEIRHEEASAALLFLKCCELPVGISVPPSLNLSVPPPPYPCVLSSVMRGRELAEIRHEEASAALLFLQRCELPTGITVPPMLNSTVSPIFPYCGR